ncbi:MAG: hypothetical protein AAGI07_07775 [Bacteroidota bacterium]
MNEIDLANIFNTINAFYLEVDGVRTRIDEPIQWDSNEIILKRNLLNANGNWEHGVNWEFTGETLSLVFDQHSGRSLILEEIANKGTDAEIYLLFGDETNDFIEFYRAELFLSQYENKDRFLHIPVRRVLFSDKFRTRADSEFELLRNTDIDGNSITPLVPKKMALFSQIIKKFYKADYTNIEDFATIFTFVNRLFNDSGKKVERIGDTWGFVGAGFFQFGFPKKTIIPLGKDLSIDTTFHIGLDRRALNRKGVIRSNGRVAPDFEEGQPHLDVEYFYEATEAGRHEIEIDWNFSANMVIRNEGGFAFFLQRYALEVFTPDEDSTEENPKGKIKTHILFEDTDTFNTTGDVQKIASRNITDTLTVDLNVGDRLRLWVYIQEDSNQLQNVVDFFQSGTSFINRDMAIRIKGFTQSEPSYTEYIPVFDALKQAALIATGRDIIKSELLETGGLKNLVLFNGRNARGWTMNEAPPVVSLSKLLRSINAIACTGMDFEKDENDNDIVNIKKAEEFYKDSEIIKLGRPAEYEESPLNDIIFNEIHVGFKKSAVGEIEESEGLNDFHDIKKYATPIRAEKNTLEILSDYLMSGTALESTRRQQKVIDDTKDTKFDEDVFMVFKADDSSFKNVQIFGLDDVIISNLRMYNFRGIADEIEVSGTGTLLDGTFSISAFSTSKAVDGTLLKGSVRVSNGLFGSSGMAGRGTITMKRNGEVIDYPESREKFNFVEGIEGEVYNLRTHPARMLRAWSKVINSGLHFYNFQDKIRYLSSKGNNITTRLRATSADTLGDILYETIKDDADFELMQLQLKRELFQPIKARCKVRVSQKELFYIRRAFENKSPDGNNNGYITTYDYDGRLVQLYPLELKYLPLNEMIEIEGIVKAKSAEKIPIDPNTGQDNGDGGGFNDGDFDKNDFDNDDFVTN